MKSVDLASPMPNIFEAFQIIAVKCSTGKCKSAIKFLVDIFKAFLLMPASIAVTCFRSCATGEVVVGVFSIPIVNENL